MGIIFDFDDEPRKMQLGRRIVFSKLDFIVDWFGTCASRSPSRPNGGRSSRFRSMLSPPD